jgi:hypothetical protein
MLRRMVCSMLVVLAPVADAQLGRQRPTYPSDPGYWVGISIGYLEGLSTTDDATGAVWRFGYTSQLRATLEKTVSRGTTVGVSAGFATAPLTYQSGTLASNVCPGSCLARADVAQYLVFVRGGGAGGTGFRGTYNAEGGVTQFSKFRERSSDVAITPPSDDYDLTFGIGGGFAYGMSRTSELYVEQSYDFVLHRQSSASTNERVPRLLNIRGGFRLGF